MRKTYLTIIIILLLPLFLDVVTLTRISAAQEKIVIWSHWASEPSKRQFVGEAIEKFEKKFPNFKVEVVWYEKAALLTALKSALMAGTGPDIFYADPDPIGANPYVLAGHLADLTDLMNWKNVDPDFYSAWKYDGRIYGFPLEVCPTYLYYNEAIFEKIGIKVPEPLRFTAAEMKEVVKKCKAAGYIPLSCGNQDRLWPGGYVPSAMMVRYAGKEKILDLYAGKLSWKDSDIAAAFRYTKELVDLKAYPEGVNAIKLGDSHVIFFAGKAAMFPMGSFYAGRAFRPPEMGGQPSDFRVGVMDFPSVPGGKGNGVATHIVGGCYVVNSASKYIKEAASLLDIMAAPEMGRRWAELVKVHTGVKRAMVGTADTYLLKTAKAHEGLEYVLLPYMVLKGELRDVWLQVACTAFIDAKVGVEEVLDRLEAARLKMAK